jgi:Ca-activated chloride channel family protein
MLFMLALMACVSEGSDRTDDPVTGAAIPEASTTTTSRRVAMPKGEPIVQDCFGHQKEHAPRHPRGGSLRPSPTGAPPPPPASGSRTRGFSGGANGKSASSAKPSKGVRMDFADEASAGAAPPERALSEPPAAEPAVVVGRTVDGALPPRPPRRPVQQPTIDWGATFHLSNDDSMSLASAQRLLWAVDQGAPFQTSEVRPHELLNYFGFDTAPVAKSDLFSVQGGAEQNDDTLSLALSVKGAVPDRMPLDLTLVVDRSCSMNGEGRMDYTKRGLNLMTDQLADGDRVDLVLFDSNVCTPLQNFVVGRDDPSLLTEAIASMQPTSSTDLDSGLREAYRIQTDRTAAEVHRRNRRVLLLTDAFLNTGSVDANLVSEVGKAFDDHGVRLTGIGVGREFNDTVLNKLTEKGKGAYVYLGSEAVVDRVFGIGFESLTRTIAHDVRFALDLPESLAMERFYGEEASTNAADIQPIHYYAGTSQVFLQDLKIRDGRVVRRDPVTLTIEYREAATGEPATYTYRTTVGALLDGERHNVDKAQALMAWSDLLIARSMGGDACGDALQDYRRHLTTLSDDAEIAYVTELTGKLCGTSVAAFAPGVAFKIKVDSDIPIAEVQLTCAGDTQRQPMQSGVSVANFRDAQPGTCTLTLQGNVAMRTEVAVPQTGGAMRCMVRGGRMNCG